MMNIAPNCAGRNRVLGRFASVGDRSARDEGAGKLLRNSKNGSCNN